MKLRTHALWGLLAALSLSGLAVLEAPVADAAMRGDVLEVQALLRSGEDVNAAQGDGMTALHWAVYHDDTGMVQLLLEAGGHVEAANRYGVRPLWVAVTNGSSPVVPLIPPKSAVIVIGPGARLMLTSISAFMLPLMSVEPLEVKMPSIRMSTGSATIGGPALSISETFTLITSPRMVLLSGSRS